MKNNQEIHITTDGKITYAVLKQDGKVLSRSEAKCHPDDKFDFETGAKIALDRLEIKKKAEQSENPFKLGDIVECIYDFKVFGIYPPQGTLGEVISIRGQGVFVRWAKGSTHGDGEWWIPTCYIRKIYHSEESFKVGDIVEYISDEVSQLDIKYFPPKGTRGEILELDDHKSAAVDYCVRVRWEKGTTSGNGEWWCRIKKLKKVESKYSFKVGDIVEYISDKVSQFDSIYFPPKGTRGKIVGLESEKTPNRCALVQWEKGTTCGDGKWWVLLTIIKKVDKFPKYSFKVGDRVRFRSWDDMESEFGVEPITGRINIRDKIYFTKDMRPLCKTCATIKSMRVRKDGLIGVELSKPSSNTEAFMYSFFVTDMLEPASTKVYKS